MLRFFFCAQKYYCLFFSKTLYFVNVLMYNSDWFVYSDEKLFIRRKTI